jgi:hypothetical protein
MCNGENYYPHYFVSFSPRFPITNWFCLGIHYSLSNGADGNIFQESMHSFGIESSINLTKPITKIAGKCQVPEECKKIKFTGYNIAGYSFVIAGLACSGISIPFFIVAFNASPRDGISKAIGTTFGCIFLCSGTAFEFGSLPFFSLHKKKVCEK